MFDLPPDLLAAVLAAPEEDAPRLVAADWLDEHDDADSAAWIRLQIAQASPPDGDTAADASSRRAELRRLRDHNVGRWLGPLAEAYRSGQARVRFRRGFVYEWWHAGEWDARLTPALATHAPLVEELRLAVTDVAADELSHLGGLPALRRALLEGFDGGRPSNATLDALARISALRQLWVAGWDRATEDAFHAARLAWLDGLPECERGRAVARCLGCDGDAFATDRDATFPLTVAHQLELAARLPGLRRLEVDLGDRREPDLPPGAFAGLLDLEAGGHLRPLLARVRPPGLRVAALSSEEPEDDRAAIAEWLAGTPGLRSLSVFVPSGAQPSGDSPSLPALPELRTLDLPLVRATGRPWLDPFRPLPELRELRLRAFGHLAAEHAPPGPSRWHPRLRWSAGLSWVRPAEAEAWRLAQVRAVTVSGVASLRLPIDLGEPAEASPGRWEWREWGDALDAELPNPHGPAALVLEAAPPGGDVGHWSEWREARGRSTGFAVWGTPTATLALTLTVGASRLLPWKEWWADAVASVTPA